ncbi:MAG: HEPN domain-containing protein [Planctomycetes bacterium]|nr:HEPN domain-containing protein [Planctomycetota bacterium]
MPAMKKSIRHLPKHLQEQLAGIRDCILDLAKDDLAMIVLFGSYARGNWVDDRYTEGQITYRYQSDFDILLVVNERRMAQQRQASQLEAAIKRRLQRQALDTPATNFITHDIVDLNKRLTRGNYFFTDIKREGRILFDSGRYKLARRGKLEPVERQRNAQDEFDHWFKSAGGFFRDFKHAFQHRDYSVAAFHLHQAVERYYHAVLLTCTGYKTKSHDIEKLGRMAGNLDAALFQVFPRDTDFERKCFELLKSAYIDARYKRSFKIGKRELTYLGERVENLRTLVRKFCKKKIAEFGASTTAAQRKR